jgi:hypothetical protein
MRIAVVQTSPIFGEVKKNVDKALSLMETSAADLCVFCHERNLNMARTGFLSRLPFDRLRTGMGIEMTNNKNVATSA